MAMIEKAKPVSSKTSFIWNAGILSRQINFKRSGQYLTLKGMGSAGGSTKNLVINIYGTTSDNLIPYHVGNNLTLITQYIASATSAEEKIDVSGYDRFILYCVYGSGTVGTDSDQIYILVEN
ncbi:MAG: hypothetical protein IJ405_03725 [Lachnospiraceae bacterium]|nr:hypothetical protein [Lachnospiraceae bacterium]